MHLDSNIQWLGLIVMPQVMIPLAELSLGTHAISFDFRETNQFRENF